MIETVLSTKYPFNAVSRCNHRCGNDDGATAQ